MGNIEKPSSAPERSNPQILRFSAHQSTNLKGRRAGIYEMEGMSVSELIFKLKNDRSIQVNGERNLDLDIIRSRRSEVALNPNNLFFPNSGIRTEEAYRAYCLSVKNFVPGTVTGPGQISDYLELAYKYQALRENLLRKNGFIATATIIDSRTYTLEVDRGKFIIHTSPISNPRQSNSAVYENPLLNRAPLIFPFH